MTAKQKVKSIGQRIKSFWVKNKVTIILMTISFLFFSGGLQKSVNKIREFTQPVDYKEFKEDIKEYKDVSREIMEQVKEITPIVMENSENIKRLTELQIHDEERWDKQFNFNGLVEGKLNISENIRKSNFRGGHVGKRIDPLTGKEIIN